MTTKDLQIEALNAEIQSLDEENSELTEKVNDLEYQIDRLEDELEDAKDELEDITSEKNSLELEADELLESAMVPKTLEDEMKRDMLIEIFSYVDLTTIQEFHKLHAEFKPKRK